MNVGRAAGVFRQIKSGDFTEQEKLRAIKTVLRMPTHNSISKARILEALDWLYGYACGSVEYRYGDTIYYASFDENFPGESEVCEYVVEDVSFSGKVYIRESEMWCDPMNPDERLFRTREEAERCLAELIAAEKEGENVSRM